MILGLADITKVSSMLTVIPIHHHQLPQAASKLVCYCYWLEKVTNGQPSDDLLTFAKKFTTQAIHRQPVSSYCRWQAVRHIASSSQTLSGFEPKCLGMDDNHAISGYLVDRAKGQIYSLKYKDGRQWKKAADTLVCSQLDIAALGWLEVAFRVVNAEVNAIMNRSPDAKMFRQTTYSLVENVRYLIDVHTNSHGELAIYETYTMPKLDCVDCLRPVSSLHGRSLIPLTRRDPSNPADWILSIGWLGNPIVRECLDTISRLNPQEYCGFF